MAIQICYYEGLQALCLDNGALRLVIIPEFGGKIASIVDKAGHEWLWHNPYLPWQKPSYGASYTGKFDLGGWDECFPAIAPRPYPLPPWKGVPIPDHGEVWALPWEWDITSEETKIEVKLGVTGVRFPYRLEKTIILPPSEPALYLHYRAINRSVCPFPFVWSTHPILRLKPGMRLLLPEGVPVRRYGDSPAHIPAEFTWPGDNQLDLSYVPEPEARWSAKLFAGPVTEGWVALYDPVSGGKWRFTFDPNQIPFVGLWLNYAGWAGADVPPYYNLGLEPSLGAPDDLESALSEWDAAALLPPKGVLEWSLTLYITPGESPDEGSQPE